MLLIRRFEEESARLYTERKIGGFLHLYIGQEAVAVGAISAINLSTDYVISAYRCHGHYLACGGSVEAGFAELLGKDTGCAKGRGGSMHFYDVKNHYYGGWGIVGAHVPVAAGMAWAVKKNKTGGVVLCFIGDGAINIGPFHEGLSLAALWGLPLIVIIENNYFSMGTPLHKTSPVEDLSIRALGYPVARDCADGFDVFDVRDCVSRAVERARSKNQTTLIDIKCYRYRGHSMADPGTYRTKEEVEEMKKKDCILQLEKILLDKGYQSLVEKIKKEVEEEITTGLSRAEAAKFPDPATVTNYVYVNS
ncbi:MAG: thiamine pyrophosphate-dependent enzyme [Deltaproteobacteria bacterium]|nr:thiamine pyrophosphate-dependent enzyme [Deltaproteobacteria bacterium]